ncbi:hypothetical protein U1Q18_044735 [Sarracenia purpurea var. burkii]
MGIAILSIVVSSSESAQEEISADPGKLEISTNGVWRPLCATVKATPSRPIRHFHKWPRQHVILRFELLSAISEVARVSE